MSVFDFLATDDRDFPQLYSPKKHDPKGKPIFRFDSEEDLKELELISVPREETYGDIPYYTSLPYILEVDWQFSPERCRQLLHHLREHMKPNRKYEFWHIWLANAHTEKTYKKGIAEGQSSIVKVGMNIMETDEQMVQQVYMQHEYLNIHFYHMPQQKRQNKK